MYRSPTKNNQTMNQMKDRMFPYVPAARANPTNASSLSARIWVSVPRAASDQSINKYV